MKWYEVIRARREELGLSQAELAKALDISQAAINKIENGSVARSRFLPRIAKRLNLDLGALDPDYRKHAVSIVTPNVEQAKLRFLDESYHGTGPEDGDTELFVCNGGRDNELWLDNISYGFIDRPPFLRGRKKVIAVVINTDIMSPEFEYGDIAFCDDSFKEMTGCTCLFISNRYRTPSAELCKIGTISGFNEEGSIIKVWFARKRDENTEVLKFDDWYNAFRILAKYYGSYDEEAPLIGQAPPNEKGG